MKVYIMCDMSRISGLLSGGNGLPAWYWFPELEKDELRIRMANEVNNAARGARAGGAKEIMAHEACPVDMIALDEEVQLVRGGKKLYLDKSFSGIAFVGQGMARNVVSSNGMEKNIRKIEFNGQEVDEMTIGALYAGSIGVPTICASGDQDCFRKIRRFIPDLEVEKNIEAAMKRSLGNIEKFKPVSIQGKVDIIFHFGLETLANMHARLPNVTKAGKKTTVVHAGGIKVAFDAYCSCGLVASVDWLDNPNIHKSCRK